MLDSDIDLVYLQQQLIQSYDLEELRTLCFTIGIKHEEIAGDTLSARSRELVKYCHRYGRLDDLLLRCKLDRPEVKWTQPSKAYRLANLPDDWIEPLQKLYRLVKAFNRNRNLPFSNDRTWQGDDIAFEMREAAPFLFNQFDVEQWLNSGSMGKQLAAIKYLDWLQDIDYVEALLRRLLTDSPFMQLHILVTLYSMVDQLNQKHQTLLKAALAKYKIERPDADREYWVNRIKAKLDT